MTFMVYLPTFQTILGDWHSCFCGKDMHDALLWYAALPDGRLEETETSFWCAFVQMGGHGCVASRTKQTVVCTSPIVRGHCVVPLPFSGCFLCYEHVGVRRCVRFLAVFAVAVDNGKNRSTQMGRVRDLATDAGTFDGEGFFFEEGFRHLELARDTSLWTKS